MLNRASIEPRTTTSSHAVRNTTQIQDGGILRPGWIQVPYVPCAQRTGRFISNIWVPLARCNGSLSQEYLGWWGTWASVGLLVDKGCGLRAGCLGGDAGPTPTCSRLEPRWSLSRVHFWPSHSPTHRRPDQRFSGLSSSHRPRSLQVVVQTRYAKASNTAPALPSSPWQNKSSTKSAMSPKGRLYGSLPTYYKPYQATSCGNISWLTDHLHRTLRAKSSSRRCQPYS